MRRIGLVLDPVFEEHDTGRGHPESAARLARIYEDASGLLDRLLLRLVETYREGER